MVNSRIQVWSHKNNDGEPVVVTLEDIVLPLFQFAKRDISEKSESFVNDAFSWNPADRSDKSCIAKEAKRKKAVIATLGQGKKPGSSINVIIEQSGFIEEKHLQEFRHVQIFSHFLQELMASRRLTENSVRA
ncbi:hypothetical protein [Endozoicomonas numazuensis]|uniref:Uncharacterized protein n=1 Tax=Endozoicomonas numazuensis TaxID=1137799 RepID=A0A081N9H9_9GAMM|nr:hypothetical protein [Endozoicomonas numazuensis]KEQ15102.1 hypothetical protein GZ78_24915 [Endozoicomonas numazuensis]